MMRLNPDPAPFTREARSTNAHQWMPSFEDVMLNQSLSVALLIWMYLINACSSCPRRAH